jgi:hypothetical protein
MKIQPPPLGTPLSNPMPHAWQAWFSDLKNKDEAVINLAHNPVTVVDSSTIDFTLATQVLTGSVKPAGLDHSLFANLNSATYSHLTATQLSGLTGGANTTLHSHAIGGPGSLLDADTLDGQHAVYFAPASHVHSSLYEPLGPVALSISTGGAATFTGDVTTKGLWAEGDIGTAGGIYSATGVSSDGGGYFVGAISSDDNISAGGDLSATGDMGCSGQVGGDNLKLTVATGTAPIAVVSTTVCTNLNADLLDGNHAAAFALAGAAPAAHALDGALHTVSGLTTGHFIKATGATSFGFAAHGLTYSDVGAQPVDSDLTAIAGITVTRGMLITGQGASPAWGGLSISAPAAGLINVLGVANGDTEPGYKALFDATVPGTIAESATAAAGSAVVAARRDHTHGAPATWAPTAHNLLSASHGDTTAGTVARGDLIVGTGASAKWAKLAVGTIGTIVSSDGTDTKYQSLATLGIAPLTHGVSQYYIPYAATTTTLGNSQLYRGNATCIGMGTTTVSTWHSSLFALEGYANNIAFQNAATLVYFNSNLYCAASSSNDWRYKIDGVGCQVIFGVGLFAFSVVPTGLAGAAATRTTCFQVGGAYLEYRALSGTAAETGGTAETQTKGDLYIAGDYATAKVYVGRLSDKKATTFVVRGRTGIEFMSISAGSIPNWVTSAGAYNLGVGMTAPNYMLDCNAIFQVDNTETSIYLRKDIATAKGKFFMGADKDCSIGYDGTNMRYNSREVGTGAHVFIGNVGIGVSPTEKLDVFGSGGFGYTDGTFQAVQKVLTLRADLISAAYSQNVFNFYTSPGITNARIGIKSKYGTDAESSELFSFTAGGYFGIGAVAPACQLHVSKEDATTNAVLYMQRLSHFSSGSIAAGFGVGHEYELENGYSNAIIAADVDVSWLNAGGDPDNPQYQLRLWDDSTDTMVSRLKISAATATIASAEAYIGIKIRDTAEGGRAIKCVAGEALAKGEVVCYLQGGTQGRVYKCPTSGNSADMPIGIVYASVANAGDAVWIVVCGRAEVLPEAGLTLTMGYVCSVSTATSGRVTQESTPSTVQHWREVGHPELNGAGNGYLTFAMIHFN